MEITQENNTSSTSSEPNPKDVIVTRFMNTTFLNSLNKIQRTNFQLDSFIEEFNIKVENPSFNF